MRRDLKKILQEFNNSPFVQFYKGEFYKGFDAFDAFDDLKFEDYFKATGYSIEERKDKILYNIEVPGFESKDVSVTVSSEYLKVQAGEKRFSILIDVSKYDVKRISANVKNGMLYVEIPVHASSSEEIKVEVK